VAILREDEDNSGMDELIETAGTLHSLEIEKVKAMVTPAFEKARDLARMIT
jgi:hypothetical protein